MSKAQSPKGPVVITGGNGFVGKYLQEELRREWPEVNIEVWDPVKSADADHGTSLPIDITKPEQYRERLRELQPDWLVHLAAVSSVVTAAKDPELARRVNVEATRDLLEAAAELSPATRVLVTSTADIYGSTPLRPAGRRGFAGQAPLPELPLSQAHPQNPYAQSKWDMEKMIEEQFLGRVLRVRAFPHIGPGQGLGFVTADFAAQIANIEKSAASREARGSERSGIIHVGNLEAKRDFTDVRDVVRAYRLLMEKGKIGEVYHVASGKAVTIQEVLDQLLGLSEAKISVEQDEGRMRPSDIEILVGDATKLRQLTDWQPTISLEQSLRDILEWWRSKPSKGK